MLKLFCLTSAIENKWSYHTDNEIHTSNY